MRIIYIFLFALFISKCLYSYTIFETSEYELDFTSNNINLIKENKINEIKIIYLNAYWIVFSHITNSIN